MNYIELMNEKANIAAARAALDEQEKKLDKQIELASHSYAQTLLERMCALGKQIEELGYHVADADFHDWIDFDVLYLDK
jgi:hypothetical protein